MLCTLGSFSHLLRQFPTSTRPFSHSISKILTNHTLGEQVTVKGWVKSLRHLKQNTFLDLSDGSCSHKLQIVLSNELPRKNLTTGASIIVHGKLSGSPKGTVELVAQELQIQGGCVTADGYPFAPRKIYSPEYIRQYLHFRPRTSKFGALLRLRSAASLQFRNYLNAEGFTQVDTPILTPNDCEGAGEVFKVVPESASLLKSMRKEGETDDVAYFNRKSFLTVSGQLHLEAAAHGLGNVYTFGPTFRAENSKSRLHLSEFYMLEAEMAFVRELSDLTGFVEQLLKNVTRKVLEVSSQDLDTCRENRPAFAWLERDFPRLSYEEVCKILLSRLGRQPRGALTKEHELEIVRHCDNTPVFVTQWPKDLKPFYMKNEGDHIAAFDLLAPNVGEMIGGSLREDSLEKLRVKAPENLDWYLDLRKFGSVPTGGFGLGFERYLQFLTGIQNIKDAIPFPRWPHNCS